MMSPLRHGAFKYLAALSMAAGFGLVRPGARLLNNSEELASESADASEDDDDDAPVRLNIEDRRKLLLLFSSDPREFVRMRVAEAAGAVSQEWPEGAQQLLRQLARDPVPEVRAAAARGLQSLLGLATPIARVELACQWATSDNAADREAIAKALCSKVSVLVTDLVIEQLGRDRRAPVRLAALRAAEQHFGENPDAYGELITRSLADPDRRVRRAARHIARSADTITDSVPRRLSDDALEA